MAYVLANEDCFVLPYKNFMSLDEKVTSSNLEFFQPENFLKQKFVLNAGNQQQEVPADAVFCI